MLATTFAALGDPIRLAVVSRLSRGDATMGELAAPHRISAPGMTKHVGVLVQAGLVSRRRVGRTVVCSLRPEALAELTAWIGDPGAYWHRTIDRLEELLEVGDD